MGCKIAAGGGKKGVKNRAAQGGFREFRKKWFEVRGDYQDTLGLQGAADSGEGSGEMVLKKYVGFVGPGARLDRAFEEVGENETPLLEVGKHFSGGLPCRGDAKRGEEKLGLTGKPRVGGIQKVWVCFWSGSVEKQGLDVNGAETRGPLQALKAAGDVLGGGELATAVARQKCGDSHIQNGRARSKGRQLNKSTVVVQGGGAAAKPGWFRGNTAAQPHRWLLKKPEGLVEVVPGLESTLGEDWLAKFGSQKRPGPVGPHSKAGKVLG